MADLGRNFFLWIKDSLRENNFRKTQWWGTYHLPELVRIFFLIGTETYVEPTHLWRGIPQGKKKMSISVCGFLHSLWDKNWHFSLFQIPLTGHRENHFLSLEGDLTQGDNDIWEVGCASCYRTFYYQQQSVILASKSTKSNSKIVVSGGWTDGGVGNMLALHGDLISILQHSHRKRKGRCYTGLPVPLDFLCLCVPSAFGFPVLLRSYVPVLSSQC